MPDEPKGPPLLLKPGDDPKIIARLPDELIELPAGFSRSVRISYQTYQHIVSRRASEVGWHVEFTIQRMSHVIENPLHVGRLTNSENRLELHGLLEDDPCGLMVSVKCLHGETWVNTAFPLGDRSLQKHIRTGKLVHVEQLQGSLFNNE
jgi:hypothetical protein